MIFNNENKVLIDTMTKTEARAFVKFLRSEILRHWDDIEKATELIEIVRKKFNL